MLLRTQRRGETGDGMQLADQRLQLGAITQGDDVSDVAACQYDRHAVDDEQVLLAEDYLVGAGDVAGEQVVQSTRRHELVEMLPGAW